MIKHILFTSVVFLFLFKANSQVVNTATADTLSGEHIGKLTISGFIDAYYGYCMNYAEGGNVPIFVSSARHNEFNLNLGYIDLRYQNKNFRARIMPGFGTYMRANYAYEPDGMRSLLEAHAGFKIFPKKNIWLDAGILGSPFTNESAISKDHLMYTRSIASEYVPYYLAGAKLSLPLSEKVNLYLFALNGWQQINDFNNQKSFASQLEITVNDKNLLNWNVYAGNERSIYAPTYRNRYFSDIYWIRNSGKWSSTACVYAGLQEVDASGEYDFQLWWQANAILRYRVSDEFSLSGRIEYLVDDNNTMFPILNEQEGFHCFGSSLSFAYHFSEHGMFRLEARNFLNQEMAFTDGKGNRMNYMNWFTSSIAIWF